jgi:hypothetical protein
MQPTTLQLVLPGRDDIPQPSHRSSMTRYVMFSPILGRVLSIADCLGIVSAILELLICSLVKYFGLTYSELAWAALSPIKGEYWG